METKVIIIENSDTWTFLYRRQLRNEAGVIIVGEFERAEEALLQIPHLRPDVALVDISLPGMSGLEFAGKMQEFPAVKVILVTSHKREFLSHNNSHGFLVLDKGDTKALLEGVRAAVAK